MVMVVVVVIAIRSIANFSWHGRRTQEYKNMGKDRLMSVHWSKTKFKKNKIDHRQET